MQKIAECRKYTRRHMKLEKKKKKETSKITHIFSVIHGEEIVHSAGMIPLCSLQPFRSDSFTWYLASDRVALIFSGPVTSNQMSTFMRWTYALLFISFMCPWIYFSISYNFKQLYYRWILKQVYHSDIRVKGQISQIRKR